MGTIPCFPVRHWNAVANAGAKWRVRAKGSAANLPEDPESAGTVPPSADTAAGQTVSALAHTS
jgi:hypothetical protein